MLADVVLVVVDAVVLVLVAGGCRPVDAVDVDVVAVAGFVPAAVVVVAGAAVVHVGRAAVVAVLVASHECGGQFCIKNQHHRYCSR